MIDAFLLAWFTHITTKILADLQYHLFGPDAMMKIFENKAENNSNNNSNDKDGNTPIEEVNGKTTPEKLEKSKKKDHRRRRTRHLFISDSEGIVHICILHIFHFFYFQSFRKNTIFFKNNGRIVLPCALFNIHSVLFSFFPVPILIILSSIGSDLSENEENGDDVHDNSEESEDEESLSELTFSGKNSIRIRIQFELDPRTRLLIFFLFPL